MFPKLIISIGLIIFNKAEIAQDEQNWIKGFTKTIQNNREIHQVIFFPAEKNVTKNPTVDNLIKELSKNILLLEMFIPNSKELTEFDFTTYNPRISLFILTNSENDRQFNRSIDLLTKLSESKRRPKCLLLLYQDVLNYQQFFKNLWIKQFLDVTVIEMEKPVDKTDSMKNYFYYYKKNYYPSKVFIYNPFSKLITTEKPSDKTVWFPDKLKNMHGYPIVASLLHAPPDVFVPKDPSKPLFGLAVIKINTWQKIINFTLVKSSITFWGKLTCSIKGSSGVGRGLVNSEFDIMGKEDSKQLCNGKNAEFSKSLNSVQIGMVVPLIKKYSESAKFQWQVKNIFIVVILPLFFWIVSRILNFSRKKWNAHYMIQLILGNVLPEEPKIQTERIIFAAFLLGCFMFSSEIFTAINQVQLKTGSSFKFETLEDVLASNIQIMIKKNYYFMMNSTDDVVLQEILKKTDWMIYSQDECVERLLKYKNLTCILEVPRAKLLLRNRKDKCGHPLVKFLNDKFPFDSGATLLGAGVPYAKRFDQVIQRVIDSGIREKWMEPYSEKKVPFAQIGKSCDTNEMESVMKIHQISYILVTGFACSTLIFIFEIIVDRIIKNELKLSLISKIRLYGIKLVLKKGEIGEI